MKRSHTCFGFILVFSCLATAGSLAGGCSKTLVWGWHTYLPYASYNQKIGQWSGLDVDLISEHLSAVGCPVKLIERPSKRALKELKLGRIDMVAAASFTDERNQYGRFSIAYRPEKIVLFFRRGEARRYPLSNFSDVITNKLKIATGLGGWYGEEYGKLKKVPKFRKNLILTNDVGNRFRMLIRERTDVVIEDLFSGIENLRKQNALGRAEVHNYALYSDNVHLLFSRKTVTENDIIQINKALMTMIKSPTYRRVFGTELAVK